MDDFNVSSLTDSRNEYCALFINRLTPLLTQGIYSIFNEDPVKLSYLPVGINKTDAKKIRFAAGLNHIY